MAPSGGGGARPARSRSLQRQGSVIIATGSDPLSHRINTDGRTVFTSDDAITGEWLPALDSRIIAACYMRPRNSGRRTPPWAVRSRI